MQLNKYYIKIRATMEGAFSTQVLSTFFVQIATLLLGIFHAAILARWLGPDGKGMVALALLLPKTLEIFLSLGINVSNVYFAGTRKIETSKLTSNTVCFIFLISFLGISLVIVLGVTGWLERLIPGVPPIIFFLYLVGFPLSLTISFLASIFQGLQEILVLNTISLIQIFVLLLLDIILIIGLQIGIIGAALAFNGSLFISSLVLLSTLHKKGYSLKPYFERGVVRSILSFGLRGYVGNSLQFFNYRIDAFILNFYLNPLDVGIYSVSVRLAELLWNFPRSVAFVIFPKATTTSPEEMNRFTPRVFWGTLGITSLGAVLLALFGQPIIQIIYGIDFLDAYTPLLLLLPGVVFNGSMKVLTSQIIGRGYPQLNSITAGLGFIITIGANIYFIPSFGVLGAALASSIAYIVMALLSAAFYLWIKRKSQLQPVLG